MPGTEGPVLPDDLQQCVSAHLPGSIDGVEKAGGGCIADAYRIESGGETFFLKWGRGEAADTFEVEAAGLQALRDAATDLLIPEPIAAQGRTADAPGFMLMTWIEPGRSDAAFWEKLGRGLAGLHRTTVDRYGLDYDNRIGELRQQNTREDSWPIFFRENRLEPQVAMARDRGRWSTSWDAALRTLYTRLDEILPQKPPASLLHGDLWNGNVMASADGQPALIDPAVYYGHRETDLAMSELFGGFDRHFYSSYNEAWPLEPGYRERKAIYNLYHLINHLNHFGTGYAGSVQSTLARFQ